MYISVISLPNPDTSNGFNQFVASVADGGGVPLPSRCSNHMRARAWCGSVWFRLQKQPGIRASEKQVGHARAHTLGFHLPGDSHVPFSAVGNGEKPGGAGRCFLPFAPFDKGGLFGVFGAFDEVGACSSINSP